MDLFIFYLLLSKSTKSEVQGYNVKTELLYFSYCYIKKKRVANRYRAEIIIISSFISKNTYLVSKICCGWASKVISTIIYQYYAFDSSRSIYIYWKFYTFSPEALIQRKLYNFSGRGGQHVLIPTDKNTSFTLEPVLKLEKRLA